MHIVTFYSFKGGVGRTMALVNVAAHLLSKGRRVLVVDFDLEAPGIGTYEIFRGATGTGIVEYVCSYIQNAAAPDVREFLADCGSGDGTGRLWLMPAGRQDSSYAARLNSIDWQRLYAEQDGFLMFEDLKAQWLEHLRPDYVLIDSRTGHTDVGGICTRQLPDAVVSLFVPNEQNLVGLQKVIKDIRREAETPRKRRIHLHFVPSNLPELDDEEGILHESLERARSLLDYDEPTAVVHHYSSLSLLKQSIFTRERPKARLAIEYTALADAIIRQNVKDRDGALAYLHRLESSLEKTQWPSIAGWGSEMEDRLQTIASNHAQDGEILAQMAVVRERLGHWQGALALLTAAIDAGNKTASVLCQRAKIYRVLSRSEEAISDFRAVLGMKEANFADIYVAVRALSELSPESLKDIEWAPGVKALNVSERLPLVAEAMVSKAMLPVAETLGRQILNEVPLDFERTLAARLVATSLIGQRRFREAKMLISPNRSDLLTDQDLSDISAVFNYAMAEWGETEQPPIDLFQKVVELDITTEGVDLGANYAQCLTVATFFAKGQAYALPWLERAHSNIRTNPVRTFSCWRYLEVSPNEFEEDLNSIKRMILGDAEIQPLFISNTEEHPIKPA